MNFYLKQFSINPKIENNDQPGKIEIVIGKDGIPTKKVETKNKPKKSIVNIHVLNIIKITLISVLISWTTCYLIYKTIEKKDSVILLSSSSHVLFVIQYILGSIYYRTKHFKSICNDHLDRLNKYNIISFSISIILSLTALLLLVFGHYINVYSDIYEDISIVGKVFICILLIIDKTLSYTIFLTNIMLFVVVFFIHINKVKNFRNILNKKINDSEQVELNIIVNDYSLIKSQYSKSVDNFNSIFSSVAVFGLIQIYYITNFKSDLIEYFNTFVFVLIFIIQLYVISKITQTIDTIKILINSQKFNDLYNNTKIFDQYTAEINDDKNSNNSKKSSQFLAKLIYNRSMSDETTSNDSGGKKKSPLSSTKSNDSNKNNPKLFKQTSMETIKSTKSEKTVTPPKLSKEDSSIHISNIYSNKSNSSLKSQMVSLSKRNKKIIEKSLKDTKLFKSFDDINENIDDINELQVRNLIKSYENFFSNQWLILTTKLNSPWKKFEVLGYEISDTVPIKRVAGIVLLFLTSTNTIRSILGI